MANGKLYWHGGTQFIVDVEYRFYDESPLSWWGELVPRDYRRFSDGDGYVIELEDGRRGRCALRKRINRAVSGTPPLYYYYFRGLGRFEEPPEETPGEPETSGGVILG